MTAQVSIAMKLHQIVVLLDAGKLDQRDTRFVSSVRGALPPGQVEALSGAQHQVIERIYSRHCS